MSNFYGILTLLCCVALCCGIPLKQESNDSLPREERQIKDVNSSSPLMPTFRQFGLPINGLPISNGFVTGTGYPVGFNGLPPQSAGSFPGALISTPNNYISSGFYGNGFLPSGPSVDYNQLNSLVSLANLPGLSSQLVPQQSQLQPVIAGNPFIGNAYPQPYLG